MRFRIFELRRGWRSGRHACFSPIVFSVRSPWISLHVYHPGEAWILPAGGGDAPEMPTFDSGGMYGLLMAVFLGFVELRGLCSHLILSSLLRQIHILPN